MRAAGMHDADIATLLGHAHRSSTTGHYTDVDIHYLVEQLEKIVVRPIIENLPYLRLVNE